jgi:hypothetical protein
MDCKTCHYGAINCGNECPIEQAKHQDQCKYYKELPDFKTTYSILNKGIDSGMKRFSWGH